MKESHARKYMRLARQVGADENPCYSRKIGVVLVDPHGRKILGTGYNGPPRGTPHCDTVAYLRNYFWPLLTVEEKAVGCAAIGGGTDDQVRERFCAAHAGKRTCPRRLVGCPSGHRLELCTCAHAETNAIVNASTDLYGASMFCWCPLPCVECTKLIVNAGVKAVYCLTADSEYLSGYGRSSSFLLAEAAVAVVEHDADWWQDSAPG